MGRRGDYDDYITAWELQIPEHKKGVWLAMCKEVAKKRGYPDTVEGLRMFLEDWIFSEFDERFTEEQKREYRNRSPLPDDYRSDG